MSFQKYANYKDSGTAWLGKIPAHWEVKPLKYLSHINSRVLSESTDPDYEFDYVDIGSVSPALGIAKTERIKFASAPSRARRLVQEGDVIVSTVRTYLRAIAPIKGSAENLVVSTGFCVVSPRDELKSAYCSYLLQSTFFVETVVAQSVGVSYPATNASDIANIKIPLPYAKEQQKIAAFLDRETAQIAALIDEQTRLISLLGEKRQAVISNAITKGLNPNAKMKDSGIEWIGEVPAHWEVKRIKHVAQINPSKSELKAMPLDTLVTFLPMECIGETGQLDVRNSKPLSDVMSGYTYLAENDVISAKITPCFENGKGAVATGLLNGIAFATTEVVPFRCVGIHNRYLYFLFSSFPFRKIAEASMYGAAGQKRVSETFFANYKCCIPPTQAEQKEIADYLDRETKKIDALVETCETAIGLLKERRTALISAAVTGNIDVRNAG